MQDKKENLSLVIRNNGPNIGGQYQDENSANLYLESYQPIRDFTNWDAGLNSLTKTNKDSHQNFGPYSYLGHTNPVTDIKVIDNMAIVAQSEYTDINKVVMTIKNTRLVVPYFFQSYLMGYDFINYNFYPTDNLAYITELSLSSITNNLEFYGDFSDWEGPTFNSHNLTHNIGTGKVPIDLSNLYIKIDYKGTYDLSLNSLSMANAEQVSTQGINPLTGNHPFVDKLNLLAGRSQIFKYSGLPYQFPSRVDTNTTIGDYSYINFKRNGFNSSSLKSFFNCIGLHTGLNDDMPMSSGPGNNIITHGNVLSIDCDISLIKYTPVMNCGKVDIYKRKTGVISGITPDSSMLSSNHGLEDGDIITITEVRGQDFNGTKYVSVSDSNKFRIYDDIQMLNRSYSGPAKSFHGKWVANGNIDNTKSNYWDHKNTITSPRGRNRYRPYTVVDQGWNGIVAVHQDPNYLNVEKLPLEIEGAQSFDNILTADYNIFIEEAKQLPGAQRFREDEINFAVTTNKGIIPERISPSSLDALYLGESSFVTNFRFGCSIDVKKVGDNYHLLIGERGPETCLYLDLLNLPVQPLNGAAYLFSIDQNLNIDLVTTVTASNATDVAQAHDSCSSEFSSSTTYPNVPIDFGPSFNSASDFDVTYKYNYVFNRHERILFDDINYNRRIEYMDGYQHWYASMLMHIWNINESLQVDGTRKIVPGANASSVFFLPDNSSYTGNNTGFNSYNVTSSRTKYFLNDPTLGVRRPPRFIRGPQISSSNSREISNRIVLNNGNLYSPISFYPFVDSFGKSVCLDYSNDTLNLLISSRTKPFIHRPEQGILNASSDIDPAMNSSVSLSPSQEARLSSVSCGHIHVFRMISSVPTFIHRIQEDGEQISLGRAIPQYDKAEKFAHTMISDNGTVFVGAPKASEFFRSTVIPNSEKSKIIIYKNINGVYTKVQSLENRNVLDINIANPHGVLNPDHKSLHIKNILNFLRYSPTIAGIGEYSVYRPSDNFGLNFKYDNEKLLTNSYSILNEFNVEHPNIISGATVFGYLETLKYIDYINIYEFNRNDLVLTYCGKFAPSFSVDDAQYSYVDILEPNVLKSIKSLGNYNYSNNTINSKTWDTLLDGRYDIVDDRIIIKDPMGYAIFQKTPSERLNRKYICIFNKSSTIDNFIQQINKSKGLNNKLIFTNPTISIGKVLSSATNDDRDGKIHKTFSASYSLLSADDYSSVENLDYSISTTLDIHQYEYLPLSINGNQIGSDTYPNLNIFLKVGEFELRSMNLFAKGMSPQNLNLYISNTMGDGNSIPLYVNQTEFSGISLYTQTNDFVKVNQGLHLYSKGKNQNEVSAGILNLTLTSGNNISGEPYADEMQLVMMGPDKVNVSNGMPLFLARNIYSSQKNLNVFTFGSTHPVDVTKINQGSANLFLRNFLGSENDVPLYVLNTGVGSVQELVVYNTQQVLPNSQTINLFISTTNVLFQTPLFIKTNDLLASSELLDLNIYGALSEVVVSEGLANIFVSGTSFSEINNGANLYVQGPPSVGTTSSIPLMVNNYVLGVDNSLELITHGSVGPSLFGATNSGVLSLYIWSSTDFGGSAPLFLKRVGIGGGDEAESSLNVFLKSETATFGIDMFTNAVNSNIGSAELCIPNSTGFSPKLINLFTRGFKE